MISQESRVQYRDEGFFFLDGVIGESDLRGLRAACDDFIAKMDARMDRAGTDVSGNSGSTAFAHLHIDAERASQPVSTLFGRERVFPMRNHVVGAIH
jgi:hypothetical protein